MQTLMETYNVSSIVYSNRVRLKTLATTTMSINIGVMRNDGKCATMDVHIGQHQAMC